jgi:hypothetical protein
MKIRYGLVAMVLAVLTTTAVAQQPEPRLLPPAQVQRAPTAPQAPPPPANPPAQGQKPAPPPAPRPQPAGQPINIRIEVTITDQRGKAPAMRKTITAVTGDQLNARIRTQAEFIGMAPVGASITPIPLNLDVMPTILPNGRVRVMLGLEYSLPALPEEPSTVPRLVRTGIQENLAVNLDDGKPLIVAQSADPVSDRQVTLEVKATILK